MDYLIAIPCANCDKELYYGVCRTYMEHEGLPVISLDVAESTSLECEECGHTTITGEFETIDEENL